MANATPIVTTTPEPKAVKAEAPATKPNAPRQGTVHVPLKSGGFSVEKV